MANNDEDLRIGADITPFQAAMRRLKQEGHAAADGVKGSFEKLASPFEAVNTKILAVGAALGVVMATLKASVAETARMAEESLKLGRAMGVSASEASVWAMTAKNVNASTEEFGAAAKGLTKKLAENEEALNAMGLRTRETNGELRNQKDLMLDAISTVNSYKEGTDRNLAAQEIFGKGLQGNSELLKLTQEEFDATADFAERLGLIVSQENVQAFEAFDNAGDQTGMVMQGLRKAIGDALMPVLTKLAEWFNAIGPAAVTVVKGAVGGLTASFWALKNGVVVVWETINAFVYAAAEPLLGLSNAIALAMTGNFAAAGERLKAIAPNISKSWSGAMERMVSSSRESAEQIWNAFATGTPAAAPGSDGRNFVAPPDKTPKAKRDASTKPAKEPSFMEYYEAELAARRRALTEENALRELSKGEELAYWQFLLDNAELTSRDRVAIEKKAADLTVEIRREAAKNAMAVDAENARASERLALGRVEAERTAARIALDLGQITKAQFLQMEEKFERDRYDIQKAALEDRLRLLEADPTTNPVEFARVKNQILELEQQHLLAIQNIKGNQAQEQHEGGIFGDISSSFSRGLETMLASAQGWRDGIYQILAGVRDAFLRNLVIEPMQQYIAAQARMLAVKLGFMTQEKAITAAGAATTVATKAGEATAVVSANAAEAASGAAASQAAIPIVGPGLAIAAFAAMMALVMGAMSSIRSARGGYDIPKGINPMTQLHEEEMVLPKQYANVIRNLAQGGGQQGGGGPGEVRIINTTDPAVIRDWLQGPEGTQVITNTILAHPELVRRVAMG